MPPYLPQNESPQSAGLRPPMCMAILAGKPNANLLNILVHLQLQRAQRGMELGFCWRVGSSSKQSKAHS